MQAQLNQKPKPLADVNPNVPAAIADAVMKYCAKSRGAGPIPRDFCGRRSRAFWASMR